MIDTMNEKRTRSSEESHEYNDIDEARSSLSLSYFHTFTFTHSISHFHAFTVSGANKNIKNLIRGVPTVVFTFTLSPHRRRPNSCSPRCSAPAPSHTRLQLRTQTLRVCVIFIMIMIIIMCAGLSLCLQLCTQTLVWLKRIIV